MSRKKTIVNILTTYRMLSRGWKLVTTCTVICKYLNWMLLFLLQVSIFSAWNSRNPSTHFSLMVSNDFKGKEDNSVGEQAIKVGTTSVSWIQIMVLTAWCSPIGAKLLIHIKKLHKGQSAHRLTCIQRTQTSVATSGLITCVRNTQLSDGL